jgi:hypothetical protein
VGVAVLAIAVMGATTLGSYVRGLDGQVQRARARLADTERLAAQSEQLRADIAALDPGGGAARGRPYAPGEMDIYRFGETVRALAARTGLRVERFQPVRSGTEELVELTVRGPAVSFVEFLNAAARQERLWKLPHFTLQGAQDAVTAVVRLGYETTTPNTP